MKSINIFFQNKNWFYKISDFEIFPRTEFYTSRKVMVKKYFFFGPLVEKTVYDLMFELPINIESPAYSKAEIEKLVDKKIETLIRKEEILNGKIL